MRLTSRGWTVVAVLAIAVAMSWEYGPRSLNAVVTPLAIALVAGLVLTARTGQPTVRRERVEDGFVGDTRTVALTVKSDGTISANVADTVGSGLTSPNGEPTAETTIDGEQRIEYDLAFDRRGEHVLGPVTITVRDVFGLVERRFTADATTTVRAYPRTDALTERAIADLQGLDDVGAPERTEFDHLREYQRGDALRDVHWKSAAKRPDGELVVTEYVADEDADAIELAAACDPGSNDADDLASAVASIAVALLDRDRRVGLAIGDERLPPRSGRQHRHELLGRLAVIDDGGYELDEDVRAAADVLVRSDGDGTRVLVDGREFAFDRLVRDRTRSQRNEGEDASASRLSNADADANGNADANANANSEVGA